MEMLFYYYFFPPFPPDLEHRPSCDSRVGVTSSPPSPPALPGPVAVPWARPRRCWRSGWEIPECSYLAGTELPPAPGSSPTPTRVRGHGRDSLIRPLPAAAMPNFSGNWKMKSSENFEELLKALGVNVMLRKIAVAAAAKPAVEIRQDGESFYIRTSTPVRTTEIRFRVGEEFEEQTVDGRPCKSLARWESEKKMVCEQRLLRGDGPKTGWAREMSSDGELILTMTADDVVCTRVYIRE
nr:cellular retinoic acid-binding protein 2 isoform X2 [Taeniopygia guttata]